MAARTLVLQPRESQRTRSARTRPERVWTRKRRVLTAVTCTLLAILTPLAAFALYAAVLIARVRPTLPSAVEIASYRPAEATKVYSSDGVLLASFQIGDRRVVPLAEISKSLVEATIAAEDSRFYQHGAIDPRGTLRAVTANLLHAGAISQGGSTITQQLARNAPRFHVGRERTLARKVREAMVAMRLEQTLSKDEILELYLNQVYYGNGAYGAEAASRTYFNKSASKLTLPEAALLAGLPQRPSLLGTQANTEAARRRRDYVLTRMLQTGKITQAHFDEARQSPIKFTIVRQTRPIRAPYFVDWVMAGLTQRYGSQAVYSGWSIVTTLNWKMQQAAERAVRGGLGYGATQAGLVCIDPHSGEVRAMVGGVDYARDQYNAMTQGMRPPGSAFKPLVYAAAFDSGTANLDTMFRDEMHDYGDPHKTWFVHNYSRIYSNQDLTVRDAIVHSVNTVAVQAALQTGLPKIVNCARELGLTSPMDSYPSLALGAFAVRPIELCAAYGTFAALGERYAPSGVESIRNEMGEVILQDSVVSRRMGSPFGSGAILQINQALRDAVLKGTGHEASRIPNAFGKTGTSSDRRDAWFVGYTPELVTAVWAASPQRLPNGRVIYRTMNGATGGNLAAPIWTRFMMTAVDDQRRINSLHGSPRWQIPLPEETLLKDKLVEAQPQQQVQPASQPASPAQLAQLQSANVEGFGTSPDFSQAQSSQNRFLAHRSYLTASNSDRMSSYEVCVDSGQLATPWCPATVTRTGRQRPSRYCTLHRAPPGEPRQLVPDEGTGQ